MNHPGGQVMMRVDQGDDVVEWRAEDVTRVMGYNQYTLADYEFVRHADRHHCWVLEGPYTLTEFIAYFAGTDIINRYTCYVNGEPGETLTVDLSDNDVAGIGGRIERLKG